jgi:hypothetical protein
VAMPHANVAAADAPSPPDPKQLYQRATAAFGLGHYAEAASLYEKAYEATADPALLYNAARTHQLAGDSDRALELYRNYLRLYTKGEQRAMVKQHIAEIEAHVGRGADASTGAGTTISKSATAPDPPVTGPPALGRKESKNPVLQTPETTAQASSEANAGLPTAKAGADDKTTGAVIPAPSIAVLPRLMPGNPASTAPQLDVTARPTEPQSTSMRRPLLRRPIFWIVAGGIVVATAATIAVAVALRDKGPPSFGMATGT